MREKPPIIAKANECTISFSATEYGYMDATFASAVASHGDGDAFSWTAGGGDYIYKIKRLSRGITAEEGVSISRWEFNQTGSDGITETLYINSPNYEIFDDQGQLANPRLVNDLCNATIDLTWEANELEKHGVGKFVEDRRGSVRLIPPRKYLA